MLPPTASLEIVICAESKLTSCATMIVETLLQIPSQQVKQLCILVNFLVTLYRFCCGSINKVIHIFGVSFITGQNQKKNPGKLLISASATVGALLLVALMCFWGCFLYKKLGKVESKSLAMEVGGGEPC